MRLDQARRVNPEVSVRIVSSASVVPKCVTEHCANVVAAVKMVCPVNWDC